MPSASEYTLSSVQAAAKLEVPLSTFNRWAAQGLIPHRRNPGQGWRKFRPADIEAFGDTLEHEGAAS